MAKQRASGLLPGGCAGSFLSGQPSCGVQPEMNPSENENMDVRKTPLKLSTRLMAAPIVSWVQIGTLKPGDLLIAETESNIYLFVITRTSEAFMVCSNSEVPGSEICIYGCSDSDIQEVSWGRLLTGKCMLLGEPDCGNEMLRTSPVTQMRLRRSSADNSSQPIRAGVSVIRVPTVKP